VWYTTIRNIGKADYCPDIKGWGAEDKQMCNIPHHFSGKLTIPLLIFLAIVLMVVLDAQDVLAGQTFTVTNTNDSGTGSLRQAILETNANPGLDVIVFNIPAWGRQPGTGKHTIQPTSPLPHITDPVIIDGYTQPGAAPATDDDQATLIIELDGIRAGEGSVSGLIISAGNSSVRGLVINRFGDVGIHIQENGGNIIEGNYIGTDVTGTVDQGNSDDGIRIWDAPGNTVGGDTAEARNIISGNNDMGVEIILSGATGNKVQGNYIGTDVTGTTDVGNSTHGVFINASGNTIGDSSSGTGNVISGNGGDGITIHEIGATGNHIIGNYIGTDAFGTEALGNSSAGVRIISCSDNALTDNTVSNNRYGIHLQSCSDNQIYNNNFIDNTTQAYATNGRGSNIFNLEKPIGGNYWSDWTTPDADGDGFVDYTYVFTGGVDNLPWARQDGWQPSPTVYYVNAVNGDDKYDGLTLQTAFATIQRGIDSSRHGDTVIVAPTTYTGPGNRDLDFLGKFITVRSIDPNNQDVVGATIIDCQGGHEEPHRGFHFHSGETLLSVLDGFTITGGFISSTIPPFPSPAGAIYCDNSSPTIANNIILNNYAANFGAVYCNNNSSPLIIGNTILDNSSSSGGGGICCRGDSSPIIVNNTISGNRAGYGAGICVWSSSPTIKGNIISNNSVSREAGHSGGGIALLSFCPAVIQNNVITGNIADYGGGIAAHNSSGPKITNNTITGNTANLGGGISGEESSLTVLNSILWNDSPDEIYFDDSSTIDITYSDIQGGWLGAGNINANPLFVDTANADYHLQAGSPCIDAGENSTIPRSMVVDLDGNPRIINGIVDMGAYENSPTLQHLRASNPSPPDGATDVTQTPTLRWTAGERVLLHDVYFGTDEEAVGNANIRSPEYKVTKDLGSESYEPGKLEWNTTYYWRVDEYNIDETISEGKVWSFRVVVLADPLAEALDTDLSFTTGGKADWFSQTTTSQYGGDAAQSGDISRDQKSWLQTTVNGTGKVNFYWKVSSEEYFDFLEFYIDGSLQDRISGSVDWQQMTYTITDSGVHTLEWQYMKDVGTDSGSDCGWVDKVVWTPAP